MSDFYTFVTEIIFNNPEKADRVEKELKEICRQLNRHTTEAGNVYFSGYVRNLGGGPYEFGMLMEDVTFVVLGELNDVYLDGACISNKVTIIHEGKIPDDQQDRINKGDIFDN